MKLVKTFRMVSIFLPDSTIYLQSLYVDNLGTIHNSQNYNTVRHAIHVHKGTGKTVEQITTLLLRCGWIIEENCYVDPIGIIRNTKSAI